MSIRRSVAIAAANTVLGLALAACGSDDGGGGGFRQAVRRARLEGLPAPVLAGREGGREQAAKEFNVKVTFEGARRRATSSSRSRCCRRARQEARRRGLRRDRQPGRRAAHAAGQERRHPRDRVRLGCRQRRAGDAPRRPTTSRPRPRPPSTWPSSRARGQDRHGRARPDQRDRCAAPRRLRRLHEEERAEHQDRRHPVRRRRPAEGDRPRQGDHRGQPRPQGHLRLERGRGDRRVHAVQGARHRRGKLEIVGFDSGKDQIDAINERPHGRRDHPEPCRHRLRDGEGGGRRPSRARACRRRSTPASTGTTRRTSTTPKIQAVLYE